MFKLIMDLICFIVIIVFIATVLFYFFPVAVVTGHSMHPTLKDGQLIVAKRLSLRAKVKADGIYLISSPSGVVAVKRLKRFDKENDLYYFLGDNPEASYDSRDYGYLSREDIIAKVIFYKHK